MLLGETVAYLAMNAFSSSVALATGRVFSPIKPAMVVVCVCDTPKKKMVKSRREFKSFGMFFFSSVHFVSVCKKLILFSFFLFQKNDMQSIRQQILQLEHDTGNRMVGLRRSFNGLLRAGGKGKNRVPQRRATGKKKSRTRRKKKRKFTKAVHPRLLSTENNTTKNEMPEISFKDAVRNWVEATNELESYKSNPEYYRTKEGSYFLLVGDEIDDDNTHLKRIVEAIEPSEETDFVRRWQRTELCYKKIKMEKFKSATKFAFRQNT